MLASVLTQDRKGQAREGHVKMRSEWKKFESLVVVFAASSLFCLYGRSATLNSPTETDLKTAAVDLFMQARILESDVEARKLMTSKLEDHYLHNKRLSVRVKSGRIVAYNFGPTNFSSSGEKEFHVEVESLWADLNEIVYATQVEKIKFILVKSEWLADEIDFIKTVPRPRILPFNVASEKRGKEALAVAKIFMKGLINRNVKLVTQRLSQDFQSRFSSPEEMEKFLFGPSEPLFVAYEPNTLTQIEPGEMEVRVRIFQVVKGKRGSGSQEAKLTVKEGRSDWNVSEFEFLKPNPQK